MSQELHQSVVAATQPSVPKNDVQKAGASKTPIQILNEYGTKSGKIPAYVLEKAEGEVHQPNFVFSVTVGDVSCKGEGSSKKAAKHMAAEAALHILQEDIAAASAVVKPDNDAVETNPNAVGTLQELALLRGWRLPEYIVLKEAGPLHRREFTVTCRLVCLSETAVGSSKKAAKKAAAEKMVEKLKALSGSSEITWTPKPRVHLENLRNSSEEKISALRRNPLSIPNTDYIQLMSELSLEQSFDVAYLDIDELTANGQYQCLAELSTSPVTVCHGTGISHSNAHNAAAHSALQYIKIIASNK
ncbi:interferon-inducible double-stranded RNA-dependent protein kinase activator A homolog [Entelurus aequoreus]|uniref:interferon-inducible double-stranded RNA-dependent protein kinase activator A homolog n=1 Tax=Entelurus aequoreus TaxID=161455 RepID=UPI002B1D766A|nr:interferon-inducible double-stranded RNA-dependent protein kinase activator A homolog [Entelurus aequoreus]